MNQESLACEADFPPGFIKAQEEGKNEPVNGPLPLNCFIPLECGNFNENMLTLGSIEDETLETVLTNLHSSVNASLFQYFKSIIDDEVERVILAREDVGFSQVILDIISF